MYDQHQEHYSGTSAMDITKLCPGIKKQRISIKANAGDILVFNSLLPHGPSDNLSSQVQMKCYPNLAPLNYLANSQAEVLATYTNGAHLTNYSHFFTGNCYKENVIHARSSCPHHVYPLCPIGQALVGAID